jgi:hypothetical protein
MPVALVQAQAAVNALAGGTTNAFVGQIAGHAFSDHMSKAAAEAAAQEAVLAAGPGRTRTKGYFERVNEHRIASVADFQALNDKYKERVYGGTG